MSLNTGLTAIPEDDIVKHLGLAQSFVSKIVMLENDSGPGGTAIAGTGRRFVSTVATTGVRRTREVDLARTIQSARPNDPMLTPRQHMLLYRARRGVMVALAVADIFARQTQLEALQSRNAVSPLTGADADQFKGLLATSGFVAAFTLAAYLSVTLSAEGKKHFFSFVPN